MSRWYEIHVDDVVLGADRHPYRVIGRVGQAFTLTRADVPGSGHVVASPPLDIEVTLVQRGDHRAEQAATAVLLGAGFSVEIIGESRK